MCLRTAFQWPGSNTREVKGGDLHIYHPLGARGGRHRHRHNTVLMSRGRTSHYLCDLPDVRNAHVVIYITELPLTPITASKTTFWSFLHRPGCEIYFHRACFAERLIWAQGPLSRINASTWAEIYTPPPNASACSHVWVNLLVFLMVRTWTRQIMNIYGRICIYAGCLCQLINCAGGKYLHDTRRCQSAQCKCKHIFAVTCIAGFLAAWWVDFILPRPWHSIAVFVK